MMIKIDSTHILGLYRKYLNDLQRVREFQRKQYSSKFGLSEYEKNFLYRAIMCGFRKIGICPFKQNEKVMIPQLGEQNGIAQVLSDMDSEIEVLEKKRDKCKAIKQGMIQELLTGKKRLV